MNETVMPMQFLDFNLISFLELNKNVKGFLMCESLDGTHFVFLFENYCTLKIFTKLEITYH